MDFQERSSGVFRYIPEASKGSRGVSEGIRGPQGISRRLMKLQGVSWAIQRDYSSLRDVSRHFRLLHL